MEITNFDLEKLIQDSIQRFYEHTELQDEKGLYGPYSLAQAIESIIAELPYPSPGLLATYLAEQIQIPIEALDIRYTSFQGSMSDDELLVHSWNELFIGICSTIVQTLIIQRHPEIRIEQSEREKKADWLHDHGTLKGYGGNTKEDDDGKKGGYRGWENIDWNDITNP
jgi:hypothetical protein